MQALLPALLLSQPFSLGTRVIEAPIVEQPFSLGETRQITVPALDPQIPWTEMVPSWNVSHGENASLTVEARVIRGGRTTRWYSFGTWSLDQNHREGSVEDQKDDDARVLTDVLRLSEPGGKVEIRLTGGVNGGDRLPNLRRLVLSFSNTKAAPLPDSPVKKVWGTVLEPPRRAQGDYPNGKVLCSPACLSMTLGYWARRLNRHELDQEVPGLTEQLWDPVYEGAGNWSYNMAAAGAKPGMVAYCARLERLSDLERWIAAGVPVTCSVSWYYLHGQELKPDENGHLVVLVGFTKSGDPVFNDPGNRKQVRRTYKRADFERAWNYSNRTVYLVYPEGHQVPTPIAAQWLTK